MKWRDWQLLIIMVLLFYLAVTITLGLMRRPSSTTKDTPAPSQTLRPTFESRATATVTSTAPPATTVPETSTPVPPATRTAIAPPSPTIAPTPTTSPEPSATPTVGTINHKVQKGENLIGIAERYGTTVQAIVRANGLANADVIYIGQKLIIPLPAEPLPSPTP